MSTGTPTDPVVQNVTAALIASPLGIRTAAAAIDPICRLVTPTTGTQTAVPDAPPSR